MTTIRDLTILIGAGFSVLAGQPLAKDINTRFDRDQREKLLVFSSGEWAWVDGREDVDLNNGTLFYDQLPYSYILNEIIITYKMEKGEFNNYEHFFNYVNDKLNVKKWIEGIYERAKNLMISDKPYLVAEPKAHADYLLVFSKSPQVNKILEIINYLIADLLGGMSLEKVKEVHENYKGFLSYIKKYKTVNIFTLNHDLLLEKLLQLEGIEYARGFTNENSEINHEGNSIPVFKNDFKANVRIYKLHGSLDYFRFQHYEHGEMMWQPTGMYNYFTTNDYRTKHTAVRIDPNTKEVIQDLNFDVVPKFITGTNKTEIIKNDLMYKELFSRFESIIKSCEELLISGYSFSDDHINDSLKNNKKLKIINQNPYQKYPFASKSIKEISTLNELT